MDVSYMGRIFRLFLMFLLLVTVVTLLNIVPRNPSFRSAPTLPSSRTAAFAVGDSLQPEKNVSFVRGLIPWTEKLISTDRTNNGKKSNAIKGRNISNDIKMAPRKTIVNVGFFEGYRRRWNYPSLFPPPPSPRTCECFNNDGVKFYADVTLESNESRTGLFEVLFFPHDVSFMHIEPTVWDTILMNSSPSQKRVYATFEGAAKLKYLALDPPHNEKIFHWSLTHHSKSDFTMPYGHYSPFSKQRSPSGPQKNWAIGKTGLVAWMSTWSVTTWKRESFVKTLRKHISVDLFGSKKPRKPCPRNSAECEQKIRSYKFYLALENSCCSEYISEKFWRTLSWDLVPIVVGAPRESYERLAPPYSFIYADDFATVEDLAKYILILHRNDDLYNQYFRWKEEGEVFVNYPDIQGKRVTSGEPPKNFFYSCNSVCKVSDKYLNDKQGTDYQRSDEMFTNSKVDSFFDPSVSWWCGSCTGCGKHNWIRTLNTE